MRCCHEVSFNFSNHSKLHDWSQGKSWQTHFLGRYFWRSGVTRTCLALTSVVYSNSSYGTMQSVWLIWTRLHINTAFFKAALAKCFFLHRSHHQADHPLGVLFLNLTHLRRGLIECSTVQAALNKRYTLHTCSHQTRCNSVAVLSKLIYKGHCHHCRP